MGISLAIALFKLITSLVQFFEQQQWYQVGRDAANAEANAEQQKRIDAANAAGATVSPTDSLHNDPNDRDNTVP